MALWRRTKALSIALLLAGALPVSAATITFEGFGLSRDVGYQHDGNNENGPAGQMNITIDGSPFIAYCVDLDNDAPGQWQAQLLPVNVINGGLAIAYLFDTFAAGVTTNNQAAALQVAIWEVLDDSPGVLNLSADNFRYFTASQSQTANVLSQAQIYLNAIPAPAVLANYVPQSVIVFSSAIDQAQHMIVPEPTSLSVLALGAMLVLRRNRR